MSNTPETGGFIFDTTCLNYFALTGSTHLLEHRYRGRAYVSRHVIEELMRGADKHRELMDVLDSDWFRILRLEDLEDLVEFSNLLKRFGKEGRNWGEAATIVLAKRNGLVAVIDDIVGRRAALKVGIHVTGIVGILARMVRDGQLTEAVAWKTHGGMVAVNPNGFRSPISERAAFSELCRGF